jgi:hypothetical protein
MHLSALYQVPEGLNPVLGYDTLEDDSHALSLAFAASPVLTHALNGVMLI